VARLRSAPILDRNPPHRLVAKRPRTHPDPKRHPPLQTPPAATASCNNYGMTTNAAIYLRISLDQTGEGFAVDRQGEDCTKIAKDRGWTVTETYIDNSISASNRKVKRPAYDRMVADHNAGRFEALICWDLDRLTRQPRQLEDWIEAAEEHGLKLVTATSTDVDLTNPTGRSNARLKAAFARQEVEQKSVRQVRAAKQRADRGKPPAGIRLTGYTATTSEVIPSEAALVLELFEKFAAGESLVGLVRYLTREGIPTRAGKPWTRQSIHAMLTNPRYAGRAIYQGKANGKSGDWEAIVPEGLFDLVQSRLDDPVRKTNRVGTDRKYLGSSLYRCGDCNGVVHISGQSYVCLDCRLLRTREPIDAHVLDVIRAELAGPDVAARFVPNNDARFAALEAQAKELRNQIEVNRANYRNGLPMDLWQERDVVLATELHRVDTARVTMLTGSAIAGILTSNDPVAAFDHAGLGEQRMLVNALLDVRLLRGRRGRNVFDPATVIITAKGTRPSAA
jgi:site-specific DNA recombinase